MGKEYPNSKPWKHLRGQLSKPQTLSYHVGGTDKRLFQFCVQGQVDNTIPKSWHPARIQAPCHISDKKFDRRLESCMLSCPLPEVTAHVKKKKKKLRLLSPIFNLTLPWFYNLPSFLILSPLCCETLFT